MLNLASILQGLEERPRPAEVLTQFRPPERFASKSFDQYEPRHPSQRAAVERLRQVGVQLEARSIWAGLTAFFARDSRRASGGIYLDGGFGVGKTHLLASLWNDATGPKAYLSFDELTYLIGMAGPDGAAQAFDDYRLLAIDEWELDDPGNLKMALAFLRGVLANQVFVAVTSNTLPLELGAGRFSQKDFQAEVEELASAFEVIRLHGDDFRHRHYEARPGTQYYADDAALRLALKSAPPNTLRVSLPDLLNGLGRVHPIRFRDFARQLDWLIVQDMGRIDALPDALRWVHFIDSVYDAGVRFTATGSVPLGEMFTADAMGGPYGKKLSRCLSRIEEMLAEDVLGGREGEGAGRESSVERYGTA